MQSTLPRWAWAVLLPAFAILGAAVYIFGRTQVAPCLGGPFSEDLQQQCFERWLENRDVVLKALDTPVPGIVLFLALIALTAWLTRVRTPETSQTVDGSAT